MEQSRYFFGLFYSKCGHFLLTFTPSHFFRAVPVIVSLEFGSDDVFQFDGVGGELPDAVGQFVGRHFILVERPAERLLVELDAVYSLLFRYNIRTYSCKGAFIFTNIERESEILSLVSMHHFLKDPFIR